MLASPPTHQGLGDDRHLCIFSSAAWQRISAQRGAAAGAGASPGGKGDRELRQRVKQLWNWCQAEGMFNYSQGGCRAHAWGRMRRP